MKKKSVVILFLFFCPLVFAHFTYDVVSNTQLVYLYEEILVKTLKELDKQYAKHIEEFNLQETKSINHKLAKMLARLNTPPSILTEKQNSLNNDIKRYNQLIQERDTKILKQTHLKNIIDEETKRALEENSLLLQWVLRQINFLAHQVNQANQKLIELETQEGYCRLFYHNQTYMTEESLQHLKAQSDEWIMQMNTTLKAKVKAYNQEVSYWKAQQTAQQEWSMEQRKNITQQEQDLKTLQTEINTLVHQYNQNRKVACLTKPCIQALKNQKAVIEQKKQEFEGQAGSLEARVSLFHQQMEKKQQQQQTKRDYLHTKHQELEQLKLAISAEREKKHQTWQENVQKQKQRAQKNWEIAQQNLNQFQAQLTKDYGTDFRLFLDKFADWSQVLSQQSPPPTTEILSTQHALCAYTHLHPFAKVASTICQHITELYTLNERDIYLNTQGVNRAEQIALNNLEEEIKNLQAQISTLSTQNQEKQKQLDQLINQYKNQQALREKQYEDLKKELEDTQDKTNQFIATAYTMKAEVLNKEYDVLRVLLSPLPKLEEEEKAFSAFKESVKNFELFMSHQVSHGRSPFPVQWTRPYQLIHLVYLKALDNPWPVLSDTHILPENFLLDHLFHYEQSQIQPVQGEEKREVILSWMHTPFISLFLKNQSYKVAHLLEKGATSFNLVAKEDLTKTSPSAHTKSQLFVQYLFGQSFYQNILFQKKSGTQRAYYHIKWDNYFGTFLPEGQLETFE